MNAPFQPEKPAAPLTIIGAHPCVAADGHSTSHGVTLTFNRALTDEEIEAYRRCPPTPRMLADTQQFASRLLVAELIARLMEFYILGGLVLPDTPAAMDWIKSYLQGNGHGPLGGPMRWPGMIVSAVNLLVRWGYEPRDGFVAKAQ